MYSFQVQVLWAPRFLYILVSVVVLHTWVSLPCSVSALSSSMSWDSGLVDFIIQYYFFYYGFYLFIFFFIHCCTVYDTGYVVCMGANDHIVLSGVCLLWTDQNVSDWLWIFFLFNNNWYHIHLELDYYIKQPLPCLSRRELHLLFLLPPPLEICTLLLR